MDFYVQKGAYPCKLLVGIPLYANTFTLTNTDSTYFGAPVTGPGNPGSITRTPGYLTYYEVSHNSHLLNVNLNFKSKEYDFMIYRKTR